VLIELRIIMLVVIAVFFTILVTMLRKQKLELKYCLVWIFGLLGISILCIFPILLDKLSAWIGIATPVFTLFLVCIAFLTCICISLTIVVSSLSDRLRQLTQNIAIQECEREINESE
jgi:hypothetical protein